jgi:anti-sigma regulatory factor (Ser/Thr protein kinase)
MEKGVRDWIMAHVPEAEYSLVRKGGAAVACYGDDSAQLLADDYEVNAIERTRTLLCLSRPCCDSYLDLLRLHVRHIIYPDAPFAGEAIRLAIFAPNAQSTLSGKGFFSLPSEHILESSFMSMSGGVAIGEIVAKSGEFLQRCGHSEHQASAAELVVKEAVTNCVFHAFRQAGAPERKYEPEKFEGLEDGDEVSVCLAKTDNGVAIRVTDNAGTLGPLRLGNSLDRHRTDRGLFDSRGRGFYLMRQLSQRLVVIVERGVGTSLEIYFMKGSPGQAQAVGTSGTEDESKRNFELFEL